jgi:replicative DNA helicase
MPPQSLEAEMAVLGAVLLDNNAFSIATESITHTAFYKKAHQGHLRRDGRSLRAR